MDTDALLHRVRMVYEGDRDGEDVEARRVLEGVIRLLRQNPDVYTDTAGALGEYCGPGSETK